MTRMGQSSSCLALVLIMLVWNRVSARPSVVTEETPQPEEDSGVMEELKGKILEDLGFHQVPTNLSTISDQEYLRAYLQYMTNVRQRRLSSRPPWKLAKERRRKASFRLHKFLPRTSSEDEDSGILTFPQSRTLLSTAAELQIRRAILYIPHDCQIDNETSSSWSPMDITQRLVSWLRQQKKVERGEEDRQEWSIPMTCAAPSSPVSEGHEQATRNNNIRLEVLVMKREGANKRIRRDMRGYRLRVSDFADGAGEGQEVKERRLGRRRAKDCGELKHGKSCCRKSLVVSFEELRITEFILAPVSFDMGYCDGRCSARRLPYASNHAIFQHMILKAGRGAKLCCSPTKLSEVDVIQRDPRREDQLKVTVIHNAKVEECGCS